MAKMTSAYASKILKKLQEDKEFWCNKEREGCIYVAASDEEPLSKFILQVFQLSRKRRLRDMQAMCRPSDTSFASDGEKIFQNS